MKKNVFWFLIINVLFFSCIERIDLDTPWLGQNLVIEGSITTLPGPYKVRVTRSTRYSSDPNLFEQSARVSGAEVFIRHMETDQAYTLLEVEDSTGEYYTSDLTFRGEVSNTYRLEVTADQSMYHSSEVTILPVSPIDSIFYEYLEEIDAVGVFVSTIDPVTESNMYRWKWSGFFHLRTSLPTDPDTFDCCIDCYVPARGKNINLAADTYINGNPILKRLVSTINLDSPSDYLVEIQQLSLDEEAYEFWKLMETQEQSSGGLFDAPAFKVKGNIVNSDNPEEEVLGLFSASAVSEAFVKVVRREFHNVPFRFIEADCRDLPFAEATQPPNWNE